MDVSIIIIVICAALFGILPLVLKSNAVFIFFALSAGELLARLTAQDATQIIRSLPATSNLPLFSIVQIVLLVIAPLIILISYRNRVSNNRIFLHVLPAVASVLVAVMLVVNKLPYETKKVIEDSSVYAEIMPFFSVAIAAGLFSSVMYLIFNRHID